MPLCLTLSNIRYVSRVKWSNPRKGVAPSPTSQCSSYWKGGLLVALDERETTCQYVYISLSFVHTHTHSLSLSLSLSLFHSLSLSFTLSLSLSLSLSLLQRFIIQSFHFSATHCTFFGSFSISLYFKWITSSISSSRTSILSFCFTFFLFPFYSIPTWDVTGFKSTYAPAFSTSQHNSMLPS